MSVLDFLFSGMLNLLPVSQYCNSRLGCNVTAAKLFYGHISKVQDVVRNIFLCIQEQASVHLC